MRREIRASAGEIVSWIKRHPLLCYFAMAYGLSWGGIVAVLAVSGFNVRALGISQYLLIFAAMALGPSVSGLTLTAALDGRTGVRALQRRMTHYRVHLRWYVVALLTTPALLVPILSILGAVADHAYLPRLQIHLFVIGLIAGALEEIGWTGFATPRLLQRFTLPITGLGLGFIWALWHGLADFSGNIAAMGAQWPFWFGVFWIATLPPYRLLMTWLYARTSSGLLAVLMHAGYTGWLFVLSPATTFEQGLVWQSAFATTLWIAALSVIILSQQSRTRSNTGG